MRRTSTRTRSQKAIWDPSSDITDKSKKTKRKSRTNIAGDPEYHTDQVPPHASVMKAIMPPQCHSSADTQTNTDSTVSDTGITDSISCVICDHVISEQVNSIQCNKCQSWIHQLCDPQLTDGRYDSHVNDTNLLYLCPPCDILNFQDNAANQ